MVVEAVELIVRKRHDPYPGVRLFANQRVAIGPPAFAEALVRRGFFEKVSDDVLAMEREAEMTKISDAVADPERPIAPEKGKKGK